MNIKQCSWKTFCFVFLVIGFSKKMFSFFSMKITLAFLVSSKCCKQLYKVQCTALQFLDIIIHMMELPLQKFVSALLYSINKAEHSPNDNFSNVRIF